VTSEHLLIPLDGSELAASVLPFARSLTTTPDAQVTLLRVLPVDSVEGDNSQAMDELRAAAGLLGAAGLTVYTALRVGEAAATILDTAEECQASLIIMATHSRTGLQRVRLGSVADGVLRSTRRPLLLVHPGAHALESLRTIVVAVDESPGAALAAATAARLARSQAARLVLIRATDPLPLVVRDPTLGIDTTLFTDPTWDEDARHAAEVHMQALAARLQRAGLIAEGRGVSGRPAAAIMATAAEVDADLIVMSTHARTGPMRSILGSVSDEVVRESRRPVLLVRHNLHAPLEAQGPGSGYYELLPDVLDEAEAGLIVY
jgi:nucleotide-binding universal stress UspA family protein